MPIDTIDPEGDDPMQRPSVRGPAKLMAGALAIAATICDNAPLSSRRSKPSIRPGLQMDPELGLMFEIEAHNRQTDTEVRRDGVLACDERRKPAPTHCQRLQPPTGR